MLLVRVRCQKRGSLKEPAHQPYRNGGYNRGIPPGAQGYNRGIRPLGLCLGDTTLFIYVLGDDTTVFY